MRFHTEDENGDWGKKQGTLPKGQCPMNQPLYISIPGGKHVHFPCPVHGEHVLRGQSIRI